MDENNAFHPVNVVSELLCAQINFRQMKLKDRRIVSYMLCCNHLAFERQNGLFFVKIFGNEALLICWARKDSRPTGSLCSGKAHVYN